MQLSNIENATFYMTYVLLLTTGTITLIEAIATKNPQIRHIMNLETCISIVAAYFYSRFIKMINESKGGVDAMKFTLIRYNDWVITTPLMLLSLILVLSFNKTPVHFGVFVVVLLANFGMLACGYLGETGVLTRTLACLLGFVFFVIVFGVIWYYVVKRYNINVFAFYVFVIIWSMYGFAYLADDRVKNVAFNVLDMFAKCLVGIFFWLYFTKVLKL